MPPIRMQDLPGTNEATCFCRDEMSQILIETLDSLLELASEVVGDPVPVSSGRILRMAHVHVRLVNRFGTQAESKKAGEILAAIERAL